MTTIVIIFMFFLVYLEVRPTYLWLLSIILSSSSQSHWHCLCWVLVKTLPFILSFSLCSRGNKNLFISYGKHYNRFWRWPSAKLLASLEQNYVFDGGKHALPIQGHPKFFYDVVADLLNNCLGEMMKVNIQHFLYQSLSFYMWLVYYVKQIWKKTHEHKSSNCGANKQGSYEVACLSCPLSLSYSVLRMCLLILIKFLSARGWYQADKSTTKGGFALDGKSSITQF